MKITSVLIISILTACSVSGQSALELAGNWHGNGSITSAWCDQDTLHFDFTISTDDEITGNVGDAVITGGVCDKAPEHEGYSYIVTIKLKGSLIECEEVKRSRMVLLINRDENLVSGTFYTEGFLFGRKENGSLTGTSLLLYYK